MLERLGPTPLGHFKDHHAPITMPDKVADLLMKVVS